MTRLGRCGCLNTEYHSPHRLVKTPQTQEVDWNNVKAHDNRHTFIVACPSGRLNLRKFGLLQMGRKYVPTSVGLYVVYIIVLNASMKNLADTLTNPTLLKSSERSCIFRLVYSRLHLSFKKIGCDSCKIILTQSVPLGGESCFHT